MAIAAAGLGSREEQKAWTVGEWLAISALLPSHDARQDMRASHRALMPSLWKHAHHAFESQWESWRAVADHSEGRRSGGSLKSPRGLGAWLKGLFGSAVRSE